MAPCGVPVRHGCLSGGSRGKLDHQLHLFLEPGNDDGITCGTWFRMEHAQIKTAQPVLFQLRQYRQVGFLFLFSLRNEILVCRP